MPGIVAGGVFAPRRDFSRCEVVELRLRVKRGAETGARTAFRRCAGAEDIVSESNLGDDTALPCSMLSFGVTAVKLSCLFGVAVGMGVTIGARLLVLPAFAFALGVSDLEFDRIEYVGVLFPRGCDKDAARGVVARGFAFFGGRRRRNDARMFGVERRRLLSLVEFELTLSFDAESPPRMVDVRHSPLTDKL